jgi:hypothetical protein
MERNADGNGPRFLTTTASPRATVEPTTAALERSFNLAPLYPRTTDAETSEDAVFDCTRDRRSGPIAASAGCARLRIASRLEFGDIDLTAV